MHHLRTFVAGVGFGILLSQNGLTAQLQWQWKIHKTDIDPAESPSAKGKEPEQLTKPGRGWEKVTVGTPSSSGSSDTTTTKEAKKLSVDANVIIHSAQNGLKEYPSASKLIDKYKLVVSNRVAREIRDKKSRDYLNKHCAVNEHDERAFELVRGYCAKLESKYDPLPKPVKFTDNEEVDLAAYLDACLRDVPHLTLDRAFVERLVLRLTDFEKYAAQKGVKLTTLYVGIKGKEGTIHKHYPSDAQVESKVRFLKVLRDK